MTNELTFSYDNGLPYKKTYIPLSIEMYQQDFIIFINALMGDDFLNDGKLAEISNPNHLNLKVVYGDTIQIWFILENEYLFIPDIPLSYSFAFNERTVRICISNNTTKENLITFSI